MAAEWTSEDAPRLSVAELAQQGVLSFGDGYRTRRDELGRPGYPILRVAQVVDGSVRPDGALDYVREEFRPAVGPKLSRADDVVLTTKGTFGRRAYLQSEDVRYVYSPQVCFFRITDRTRLHPRYLYYWLGTQDFANQAHGMKSQTDMADYLSLRDLSRVTVPMPPLAVQRGVAEVMGALDDKIEQYRRMSETLQATAGALFNSWFVDFDAVRSNLQGQHSGLQQPSFALFPDSFQDSVLGRLPNGWRAETLDDVLSQRVDRRAASADTSNQPYVPIDCIAPRSLSLVESRPGEEAKSSLTAFRQGDLLFGAMRPYFHKVCVAPFAGTTRTTVFVLVPRAAEDFAYATLLLHRSETIDYAAAHSTGSTIPYAVWSGSLANMPIVMPSPLVRQAFDIFVRPILQRIAHTYFPVHTLAALRDALLPKLISGELRVPDAERIAVEAGA